MGKDVLESIRSRATGESMQQTGAQTPIVTVVAHVTDDIDHTEAQRLAGVVRREIVNTTSFAEGADSDYTVDSIGVETISAIAVDDLTAIRDQLRRVLEDEGYTVDETAVMAEITTSTF
jgi:hypothetical protein